MNTLLRAMLATLSADSTTLEGKFVGLYTALSASLGPNLTMANLTEPTYTGYARQALASWSAPYMSSSGRNAIIDSALHFTASDTVTTNVILGAFLGSSSVTGAGTLEYIDPFPNGITISGPTTEITYVPEFDLDPGANFGGGTLVS
jgi:hypothetical protein